MVYTDYRPTPLQHYIYPAGGDGIHLVVDENVSFDFSDSHTAVLESENIEYLSSSVANQFSMK